MFYWWPLVKDCGVPMPKTVMVRHEGAFKGRLSFDPIDGKPDSDFDVMLEGVKVAAAEIGYPVFIRSDGTANKHDWKNSCYVESEDQLRSHICNILEMTAMAFGLRFNGIAVREFLELNWKFTAMRGDMPVAREFRMFVKDGVCQCMHPYWPPASINNASIDNWYEVLTEMQSIKNSTEGSKLTLLAEKVGEVIEGYWSIDLCQLKDGQWFMTDMAVAEESYHWGTCPNAPPEMLRNYGYPDIIKDPLSQELIKRAMKE
jgi:hypothetical protein